MFRKIKRIVACFLAVVLILPSICIRAASQPDNGQKSDQEQIADDADTVSSDDEVYVNRTPQEVLKTMKLACENSNFQFFYSEEEDLLALRNKKNSYIWWSSPINAQGDKSEKAMIKKELASSMTVVYGEPSGRSTSTLRSARNAKISYETSGNTLRATYRYNAAGFIIPVEYTLEDDCLTARIKTSEINEKNKDKSDGQIILSLSVLPNIACAGSDEEGYYIIPDGCGATINFNNGKVNARPYLGRVYGDDITSVPLTRPAVTKQLYLPVYGMVNSNGNAMLAVIDKGDSNAEISSNISGLSKSSYNLCSSSFVVRNTDTYYMNKEPLTVFEKGDIKTPELAMKFYPLSGKDIGYEDVASRYRKYLMDVKGVKPEQNDTSLYINFYGGTRKQEPVAGIPVTRKKAITTFSQAEEIVESLIQTGTEKIIVSMDNWTNDGINNKVDYKASPSSVLGSKGDFRSMTEFFSKNDVLFYPVVNNKTFSTGNGYWTFTDTALRTSGQYSKQISYNLAYGTQNGLEDPVSLLSPSTFPEIYTRLSENYSRAGLNGICIGDMTSVLYADYGKKQISRDQTMGFIENGLEKCRSQIGSVLADTANAFTLGYVDRIAGVPVSSSRFDIFDDDIPFYQLVIHGLIPYSIQAVNGSSDPERQLLMAVATGSSPCYDMIYEETSELKDTEYDIYYYANYKYWTDTAAGGYRLVRDVLGQVGNEHITGYKNDGNTAVTTYSNGTVITVDFQTNEISDGKKVYRLEDYIDMEGDIVF